MSTPDLGSSRLDEVRENIDQGTDLADEQQMDAIWEHFSEAQRNILYLHKHWLVAMEELKYLLDGNKSLLQEMEVLEMERQGAAKTFLATRN